jgi:hypothetical protein
MTLRMVAALAPLLLLTACQVPAGPSGCNTQIDWVDFVQVGSTQYVAGPEPAPLPESDVGPAVARVRHKLSGNVCDPGYRPQDGDAAFLDPGTLVYQVKNRPPTELLAARRSGRIQPYTAKIAG